MTFIKDSIALRPGEELDLETLDHYLRRQLSTLTFDPGSALELGQFPGGHSNLTYLVRYGEKEFVLRRPPIGPVAPTAHDMPREYNLLCVIHPHFPLAPKPFLLCEDVAVIGAPFYLMERRQGLIVRQSLPGPLSDDLIARRQLSETVVDTLAALHAVDIYATGIVSIGKPEGLVRRQVHGWTERWRRSKTGDLDQMERVIEWLEQRMPPEADGTAATIVHNDFKLDNLMLAGDDPTSVIAVLDWEMTTVGDPLIDLGLLLTYWTMRGAKDSEQNRSLTAVTNGPGWFTREEILARYQAKTGRDLSRIVFYEVFARFKIAVVIQQIYFRYVKGQTQDQRFRTLDVLVNALACEALTLAEGRKA
ncbi:MAG TPA: phosphotransferase family protein [Pyrinomonadaceae bacterium]|nr:phosphotransferase family protein [Pyrinomonadaceae bacterium]